MVTFHGTELVRGWSVRVGEITGTSLEFDMVYGESSCLAHVKKWGVVINGGLGVGWFVGEKEKQTHTDGIKQTTKKMGGRRPREKVETVV
jgi:hypothetical protein